MKDATGAFLSSLLIAFPNLCELRLNIQSWHHTFQISPDKMQFPLGTGNTFTRLRSAHIVCPPIPVRIDMGIFVDKLPSLKFLTILGDHISDLSGVMAQVQSVCLVTKRGFSKLPFPRRFRLTSVFPNLRVIQFHLIAFPGIEDFSFSLQCLHSLTNIKLEFDNNFSFKSIPDVLKSCPDVVELSLRLPPYPPFSPEIFVSFI